MISYSWIVAVQYIWAGVILFSIIFPKKNLRTPIKLGVGSRHLNLQNPVATPLISFLSNLDTLKIIFYLVLAKVNCAPKTNLMACDSSKNPVFFLFLITGQSKRSWNIPNGYELYSCVFMNCFWVHGGLHGQKLVKIWSCTPNERPKS